MHCPGWSGNVFQELVVPEAMYNLPIHLRRTGKALFYPNTGCKKQNQ